MSYKKTINIPSTAFPMRANLGENQAKWQALWEQKKIFKKLKTREGETFILHDGPPYANGNIHVGHALNKILKDFVIRYKALCNYKIEYIPGWDTHGLPIENRLEKTLGNEYKSKSTEEKRKICKEYAEEQIEIQKSQFKKLNLIADFEEIYKTLSPECISNELDIFCELVAKDLIYWSLKPVAWSWSSQTALAESEIIYKEVENESIYFSFPIAKPFKDLPQNTKFLIWTTTPYTLEANLAIAFNPNLKYLLISDKKESIVIQEDRYKALLEELELGKYEIIGEFFGNYFEEVTYINTVTGEERFAINAEYITSDAGTGIVHTAPGFGLEDYIWASKYGIPMHCEINDLGYFTPQSKIKEFAGHFYLEVSKLVIEILRNNGSLRKVAKIKHKVGHDWRTEKPILYRASPQWFINIAKIKNKFEEMDSDFESTPDWIKTKLKNLIISRKEWCISRQRSWGTPIPIIFFNDQPILDVSQIKHTISLLKKHGVNSWFREKAEFFVEKKQEGEYKKSTDVLDVWFDSGSTWKMLGGKKADIYLEGFDQLRGWFNSSATISKAVEDRLPFKKIIGHGFVLDENGNKMSKSKGNVIDPLEIVEKYGADILRLWIGSQDYRDDLKLSSISLENSISTYRKIRNTLFRYSLSIFECFREFKPNPEVLKSLKYNENQFIYWKFKNINAEVKNSLEKNHFFAAMHLYSSFLHNEWSWYLEISKDILYCGEDKGRQRLIEIQNIIYSVFWESLLVWSIFIPQTAEEVYSYMEKENKQESISLETLSLTTDSSKIGNSLLWSEFFKLKNQIYTEVEKLKNAKIINSSAEAKVKISKNPQNQEILNSWDLIYLLNIAEIEILEGQENISLEKSKLPKCERCKKHKNMNGSLCDRCKQNIPA